MVEIYFGLTDKHIDNFQMIIKHRHNDKDAQKILITDNDNYEADLWDSVIRSESKFIQKGKNRYEDFLFMIKKIRTYKSMIDKIKIYRSEPKVRIYIAYIEDIMANFLFFSFHDDPDIMIVEDGILNYYDHNFKNVSKARFYIKKILSSFYGIEFKKYEGHSSGIEYDRAKKQYLSFPRLAFISKQAYQMPLKRITIDKPKSGLYIIGQENLVSISGGEYYKKVFCKFIDELKACIQSARIEVIYYKPRKQRTDLDFELTYMQSAFVDKKIEILDNSLLAEEDYFKNVRSAYIASMISSALLTIYSKASDRSREDIRFIYKPIMNSKISYLFEKLEFIKLGK